MIYHGYFQTYLSFAEMFCYSLSGAISFIIYFCSGYDDKNH